MSRFRLFWVKWKLYSIGLLRNWIRCSQCILFLPIERFVSCLYRKHVHLLAFVDEQSQSRVFVLSEKRDGNHAINSNDFLQFLHFLWEITGNDHLKGENWNERHFLQCCIFVLSSLVSSYNFHDTFMFWFLKLWELGYLWSLPFL